MTAAELARGFALPYAGDLPGQIEERYVQLGALPPATQRLMLLAAADPTGDAMLLCAAQTLGIEREAAIPADAEQLLEIGTRVRFRHPLVTSAVSGGPAAGSPCCAPGADGADRSEPLAPPSCVATSSS